ncbi:MAG: choice-of-anchor I family protein [Marinicellaceae bacterium]
MFKKLLLLSALLQFSITNAEITLTKVATYNTTFGEGSAEISAYDSKSQRLFVINSAFASFSIVDLANPLNPLSVATIDISTIGSSITSITVNNGLVAASIPADVITDNGAVAFFDINGTLQNQVIVGALPDMLTFNHQGNVILVANEGEPNEGIDPDGSISIINLDNGLENITVETIDFTEFNSQQPRFSELPKEVIIFPNRSVSQDLEPEFISILKDDSKAYVTLQENNAVAVIDLQTLQINAIHALGFKNHNVLGNELDPSNEDGLKNNGSIEIANWPVLGMYQPDSIASYSIGNADYYLTANEGDARDEDVRIKDLILDPTVFPDATLLQTNSQLGRLKVSNILGDIDGDKDFDQLYAYGGRSFSIWDAETGNQVFDSGSEIEMQVAIQNPEIFNSNGGTVDSFDSRSDDKGPEPEGLIVNQIGSQYYAFIGLERVGGVVVYNITNPNQSKLEVFQSSTDGDQAPEGLLFKKILIIV